MPLALQKINKRKTGFFRFKQFNGKFLLTNDVGAYLFLNHLEFEGFLSGEIQNTFPLKYSELQDRGFIRNKLDFATLSKRYALKNRVDTGPDLHIIVVTLRCDHKCIYCQAVSENLLAKDFDMQIPVAKKVADNIFLSPNKNISIEFQGGEPLVNFATVKFIVTYALKKNESAKKNLTFSLVSNLSLMNNDDLRFILDNKIRICTSLDGPENIHNKCRIAGNKKNSYKNTIKWSKILKEKFRKSRFPLELNALLTVTRLSLSYPREIVDEYVKLGLNGIHLRPLSPLGIFSQKRRKIDYSADEFIKFYIKALEYIISLNLKGMKFHERTAKIFLTKILTDADPKYLDLRSPCGAGTGQLAYNFNGDVYTCDEGRMLSRLGDESFKLDTIDDFSYDRLFNSPILKSMCTASCLDILPGCSDCVYKPYCGVCPVCNHKVNDNLFTKTSFLCRINEGILQYLFEKLQDKKTEEIFYRWVR